MTAAKDIESLPCKVKPCEVEKRWLGKDEAGRV